jgi:hypothetical protein
MKFESKFFIHESNNQSLTNIPLCYGLHALVVVLVILIWGDTGCYGAFVLRLQNSFVVNCFM